MKKILSVLLSFALVACMMPSMVFAAETTQMGYTINADKNGTVTVTSDSDQFGLFSDVKGFDGVDVNGTFNGRAVKAVVSKTEDAITATPKEGYAPKALEIANVVKELIEDQNAGGAGDEVLAVKGAYVQIGDKKAIVTEDGTNKYEIKDVAPIKGCEAYIPAGTYQAKGYSVTLKCDFTISTDLAIDSFDGDISKGVTLDNLQKLANAAIDAAVAKGTVNVTVNSTVDIEYDDTKKVTTTVDVDSKGTETEKVEVVDMETGKVLQTTTTVTKADKSKTITDVKYSTRKGSNITTTTVTNVTSKGVETSKVSAKIDAPEFKSDIKVAAEKTGNKVTSATAKVYSDNTKATLTASHVSNIVSVTGTDNTKIKIYTKTKSGKTAYTVEVNAKDIKSKKSLYLLRVDSNGKKRLVNSTKYNTKSPGSINVGLSTTKGYKYVLVNKTEKTKVVDGIKKWVKSLPSKATIKKGKTKKMTLQSSVYWGNVKSISFSSSKKSVATVTKSKDGRSCKIKGKKAGTATIKAVVTLKDNSKKTVYTKVTVKR